jgi:hypothetical protein
LVTATFIKGYSRPLPAINSSPSAICNPIFSGKLPQAFIEGRSFDLGFGKKIVRYEPVKYNQVADKDLQFDSDMIVINMNFGNIARILSAGEVDPVGICRKTNEPANED